jgi:hypothetical protein
MRWCRSDDPCDLNDDDETEQAELAHTFHERCEFLSFGVQECRRDSRVRVGRGGVEKIHGRIKFSKDTPNCKSSYFLHSFFILY